MALYQHRTEDREDPDGSVWVAILPELVEVRCAFCGGEAFAQHCPGDGRNHHHGRVHTPSGGLEPTCNDCRDIVAGLWNPHLISAD